MKHLKYIGFLLIVLFPLNVQALISLDCAGTAKPNTETSCYISSDGNINRFEATLGIDPKVTYFGVLPGNSFQNETINKNLKFTSTSGGTAVAIFKVFVPATINSNTTFTVSLTNIKYAFTTDNKERTQRDLSATVSVVIPTTPTTTTKKVDQPPAGTEKTFTVTLDSNNGSNKKSTLSCKTTGSNCNIDLANAEIPTKNGWQFAGWGNNVTCTAGNKASYKADADTTLYACWTASTTNPTTNTTTSNVTPGGSVHLKTLTIEGQEINFSKFKFTYDLTVLYEIESLVIKAEAAVEGTTVEIGDASALQVGDNKIIIKLADSEGNTSDYVLNVKRLKEGEIIKELSPDTTLKSVSLGKYQVNFSPMIFDYTIEIDSKTTSIPVTAITNDENATYEVEGNTSIVNGSVIKINVTAEDGTTNTYNFHITVKKNFIEEYKMYIGIGGALVLLLIILIIINKSKKKTPKTPTGASKAPTKKMPTAAPKAVPRTVPKPPVTHTDPKSQVEVLDI